MKKSLAIILIFSAIKIFQLFCATIINSIASSEGGVRVLGVLFSWMACCLIMYFVEKKNISKYPIGYTLIFIVCLYIFFLTPAFLLERGEDMILIMIIAVFFLGYFSAEAKVINTFNKVFGEAGVLFQIFIPALIAFVYYFSNTHNSWRNIAAFILMSAITFILSKSTFIHPILKTLKPKPKNQILSSSVVMAFGLMFYAAFIYNNSRDSGMAAITLGLISTGAMYLYMYIDDRFSY